MTDPLHAGENGFVTDAEIARRWGVSEKTARVAISDLSRSGFPKRDPLFADKRYWPAVKAFMARRAGLTVASQVTDGEENHGPSTHRRRAGTMLAAPPQRPLGRGLDRA